MDEIAEFRYTLRQNRPNKKRYGNANRVYVDPCPKIRPSLLHCDLQDICNVIHIMIHKLDEF